MIKAVLFLVSFVFLIFAHAQSSHDLENGVAVTNPAFLRALERKGFSINQVIGVSSEEELLANDSFFNAPQVKIIKDTVANDLTQFKNENKNVGVGTSFSKRLFDIKNLSTHRARFVLVGVINRQDRAYESPQNCGETRLIYRLAYNIKVDDEDVMSRLPMTMNVIFNAKTSEENISCQVLAKRWLKMPNLNLEQIDDIKNAVSLASSEGSFLDRSRFSQKYLKAIEINLQVIRSPAAVVPDFGAHSVYLLRNFKWNKALNAFEIDYLENQIDKDRIAKDLILLKRLNLAIKNNIKAINDGTYLFAEEFLAKKALSVSPAGLKRIENRPFSNLISRETIDEMNIEWSELDLLKSTSGLLRRLNDLTCTGCHQTKSVAGFHFPGKDPQGKYPGNSVFMPGSPHFYGDLIRRKNILTSISEAKVVNYLRSFAERPANNPETKAKLDHSGLFNGWGSHCSVSDDPTFKSWDCASGLKCKSLLSSDYDRHIGVCVSLNEQEVGQPCEAGTISLAGKYTKTSSLTLADANNFLCSPQSATPGKSTGGFPSGSVRRVNCNNLSSVEACGVLPASKSGFNSCIGSSQNFLKCIREYSANVGLRACDQYKTCRDDYICAESNSTKVGVCLPPYFLFQFRVDGHPVK